VTLKQLFTCDEFYKYHYYIQSLMLSILSPNASTKYTLIVILILLLCKKLLYSFCQVSKVSATQSIDLLAVLQLLNQMSYTNSIFNSQ